MDVHYYLIKMMFVEDILLIIAEQIMMFPTSLGGKLSSEWHINFLENMHTHVINDRALSMEQSRIIMKIVEKVRDNLVENGNVSAEEIDELIHKPNHKFPPYQSANIKKEVRYLGDNCLGFRFKFNETLLSKIREIRDETNNETARFDLINRIWIIPVTIKNLHKIKTLIKEERFSIDASTENYLTLVKETSREPSTFTIDEESGLIVAKVYNNEILAKWITSIAEGEII